MKKSFHQSSYLSQVRKLRKLARKALEEFPIKVKSIRFIHHGENTTFRIQANKGATYLLRIHRNDYHTKSAIIEEMRWLGHLAKTGFSVPKPVLSKDKSWVKTIETSDVGSRNCTVFEWIHGGFIRKSVQPKHLFEIGQLLANLQNNVPKGRTKNRQYWTAEGLVGSRPKFGSLDQLSSVSSGVQKTLTRARKRVLKKLKQFEKKHPDRRGLIHADLHFGNIVSTGKNFGAIDFDDCGYGFFAYDLVIPYLSVRNLLGEKKKHLFPVYKKALFDGYKTKRKWDSDDEVIFPYLVTARKLLMLGWLNSRSDNPRLKKYLKVAVKSALLHLKGKD